MNNLPIRWADDPRLADVRARVEADAALLTARATLVRAVLALYAADILHSERPDVFATLGAWTEAEQATYAAAAAYLAAGGSEEAG